MIYQVALNIKVNQTFSYATDQTTGEDLTGHLVLVPFGKNQSKEKNAVGFVVAKASEEEITNIQIKKIKCKSILEKLSQKACLKQYEIEWLLELSNYYHQPVGQVFFKALPKKYQSLNALNSQENKKTLRIFNYWKLQQKEAGHEKKPYKLGVKQQELFDFINTNFKNTPFSEANLQKIIPGFSQLRLKKLESIGLIEKVDPDFSKPKDERKIKLRQEQLAIKKKIEAKLKKFSINLIYGDTGSGKTEIYLDLMNGVLKQNKQVLYLVPEIGLVAQSVERIQKSTSLPVLAMHSNLSNNEQNQIYSQIQTGQFAIVVGTRLSSFLSFKNLGLVIIDEEHDGSYKQIEKLYYQAKEIIYLKAKKLNIPVVTGSATPCLETFKLVNDKKINLYRLEIKEQASRRKVQIIDMQNEPKDRLLSYPLLNKISETLKNQKQCLLFLNRRGFAPLLKCNHCNWVLYCDDCDYPMVFHRFDEKMHCHHCYIKKTPLNKCPVCAYKPLKLIGSGTEKLEQILENQFSDVPIWRIDKDKTSKKEEFEKILTAIESSPNGLIVGTQMISKGHDFSHIGLVALIDVDWYLKKHDIYSKEKFAQLFIQVMGRTGRGDLNCDVVLQTRNADQNLTQKLIQQGYGGFIHNALAEAKKYQQPPFAYQAACMADNPDRKKLYRFLNLWRDALLGFNFDGEIEFWSVEPNPIEKKSKRYYAYFLIFSKSRLRIHQALNISIKNIIPKIKTDNQTRYHLDINCTGIDF